MRKQIHIHGVQSIQALTHAACAWADDIRVTDGFGDVANAKSILGMLRLDYSRPVQISSGNPAAVQCLCHALGVG